MALPICPTCSQVIPPSFMGRPRTYCTPECRREMGRRRRELDDLETELAEARYQESQRVGTWRARWSREIAWLTTALEKARDGVPEEMQ